MAGCGRQGPSEEARDRAPGPRQAAERDRAAVGGAPGRRRVPHMLLPRGRGEDHGDRRHGAQGHHQGRQEELRRGPKQGDEVSGEAPRGDGGGGALARRGAIAAASHVDSEGARAQAPLEEGPEQAAERHVRERAGAGD